MVKPTLYFTASITLLKKPPPILNCMHYFIKAIRVGVPVLALLAMPSLTLALDNASSAVCQVQVRLQRGDHGANVTALQQALGTLGYFQGDSTGYFGSVTAAAVVQFQKDSNLDAIGEVGPLTHAALNAKVCADSSSISIQGTTNGAAADTRTQTSSRNQSALTASVSAAVRAATGSVAVPAVQHVLLPAYFNPGPLWDKVAATLPGVGGYVVLDITGTGAGNAIDTGYAAAVAKARSAGVKVVGYVATAYGSRSKDAIENDIDHYKAWYHVDGIFLDQVSTSAAHIPFYQGLADYIRASSGSYVVLNPGAVPDQGYLSVGDTVNIFEDTYNHYLSWQPPSWISAYPSSKISELVYAAPDAASMSEVLSASKAHNAGFVYVTDDRGANPWDTVPTYWSAELTALGGVSAPPVYAFANGDRVQTTSRLAVRSTPRAGSNRLGVQADGAFGTVVDGPQADSRYTWWQIQYDNGVTGWSAENWLEKTVSSTPAPTPTVTLSANSASVSSGQSATLSWSSTNATSCSGSGFTTSGTNGSVTVTPTTSTSYSVTCTGAGGSAHDSVTVLVSTITAPTVTLSASPAAIATGNTTTLSWSSTNATSCTGSGFAANQTNGSVTVTPSLTTTYAVTCTGAGGSVSKSATVSVSSAVDTSPPSVPLGLTATPVSSTQINLAWNASTDTVGVTAYRVYRSGVLLATVTGTSYQNSGLSPNTTYEYAVTAQDAKGNMSGKSATVNATTLTGAVSSWWAPGPTALAWQWEISHPLNLNSPTDMGTGQSTYSGAVAAAPEVYDIDGFDNPASTVAALHAAGKKVVCYIEVGSAENYRPDYSTFPAAVLGKTMSGYAAERYIDIRSPQVVSIIKARIKMCADKGFDAIEPDIDESYMSNTGFPLTKAIEEAYMTTLTNYAHSLGVAMWGKNPDDTEDSYAADMVNVFDAILTESCNQYNTCTYLDAYTGKKPVFNAEYKTSPNTFCPADTKRVGWSGVKFPLSLNGNRTTCF